MNAKTSPTPPAAQENRAARQDRLPLVGLLALASAAFITIMTEALPAGLLQQIGADLAVSEALSGQLVTIYAFGSLIAAIPLTAATRGWRRRRLLMLAIGGFFIVNTVTAVSTSYPLTMLARFFAGVFAGLLWALVAGYASRMAPAHLRGRAIAIAMAGTPLALSLGIPLGTLLGETLGWRYSFGLMSLLTLILCAWVRLALPDFAGQAASKQLPIAKVLVLPGVRPVLFVTLVFVLAHNILYTYIAPFLAAIDMATSVHTVLFIFGVTALAGIGLVGVAIDLWLRELVLISIALFGLAAIVLGAGSNVSVLVYTGVAAWGLAFGGVATLFQTALANSTGESADVGQSMLVTAWNMAIAGGGLVGGVILETVGVTVLPWIIAVALPPTLWVAWSAQRHGFPRVRGTRAA